LSALPAFFSAQGQNPSIFTKKTRANHQQKIAAVKKAAISTLEPLLDELREVENLQERVALAQPLVSLLSTTRPEACRKLLRLLLEDCLRLKNEASDQQGVEPDPDLLAKTIIQIAATFDRKLAKSLLEKYDSQDDFQQKKSSASMEASRTKFHLTVATQLLIDGNVVLATSIAERVISGPVIPETLRFLSLLREKDLTRANTLFAMALGGIRLRGGIDPNESLLLFSYIFSPHQIPIVTPRGLGIYQMANVSVLPTGLANPVLAQQYLDTTSQLLLDPARYSRPDLPPAFGPVGDWFLIKFIEPKALVYRPALVNPLLAQRYVLESWMPDRRNEASASLDRWNLSDQKTNAGTTGDTVESLLKRAAESANSKRRDQLLYRAAMAAVKLDEYDRALKIADELSFEYRKEAKQFLTLSIAIASIRKDDIERAARLAEKDEDLLRQGYVFTLIGRSLVERKNADIKQARFYLAAVEGLIPKLGSDKDRVSALTGVLQVYSLFDKAEALRSLRELVMYANKVEVFEGDRSVSRLLDIGGFYFDYSLFTDFSLNEGLRSLALLEFESTLEDVRQMESRTARLKAIVAVCQGVLAAKS